MKKNRKYVAFDLCSDPDVMYHLDRWYYERWGYYVLESINRYIYGVPEETENEENMYMNALEEIL